MQGLKQPLDRPGSGSQAHRLLRSKLDESPVKQSKKITLFNSIIIIPLSDMGQLLISRRSKHN